MISKLFRLFAVVLLVGASALALTSLSAQKISADTLQLRELIVELKQSHRYTALALELESISKKRFVAAAQITPLLLDLLNDGDGPVQEKAALALAKTGDLSLAPALIEFLRFSFSPLLGEALETLTGQEFGAEARLWFEWMWANSIKPFEGFLNWKIELYMRLVPGLSAYFYPGIRHAREIELDKIVWGGVPPRGIPALNNPQFVTPEAAGYLHNDDIVFGVEVNGDVRAYPQRVADWHELINDVVGNRPVVLSYCPLCGSAVLYDREVEGKIYTFHTSGLLYQSNKLMADDQTKSLWPNLLGRPVVGRLSGRNIKLKRYPLTQTTWGEWKRRHPTTRLLADKQPGFFSSYEYHEPYEVYRVTRENMVPVSRRDDRLPPKEWVLGINLNGRAKAYPLKALEEKGVLNDSLAGTNLVIIAERLIGGSSCWFCAGVARAYVRSSHNFTRLDSDRLRDESGNVWLLLEDSLVNVRSGEKLTRLDGQVTYWFAWYAFHPHTELYHDGDR